MQTMSHDYARLYHRGLRGFERSDRQERRFQLAMCVLLTLALLGALCLCGGIQ